MRRRLGAVLLVGALATSGCGYARTPPDEVVTATIDPEPAPPVPPGAAPTTEGPEGELVTPTPGMLDVRPVEWDEASVDGSTVTVSWWSGVAPCNVLDHVDVVEREDEVVLTLFEGTADRDAACIELAERKRTVVELDEPVGQRRLVDGAAPAS